MTWLDKAKAIAVLMDTHGLNSIDCEGIRMDKAQHTGPFLKALPEKALTPEEQMKKEEEELYWSATK